MLRRRPWLESTVQIAIYVYDEVEVLDFAGPFEVFSIAARVASPEAATPVCLVGQSGQPVRARGGLVVHPHASTDAHPPIDVLIVPGGVHHAEMEKPAVLTWLATVDRSTRLTASICTGAFLLAQAGVLTDQRVTTHWADIEALRRQFPRLEVVERTRWVDAGRWATSAGISAGIDLALHLAGRLFGEAVARETAHRMEYDWRPG